MTARPRNAVCLVCTDRWRSMDFYREAFGAELLSQDTPVTCPWLRIGDLTITLVENTERISPLEFSENAMATLLLRVDDVNAAGGPDCSSIGVPKAQEALRALQVPPVAGAIPIDKLSVLPA